MTRMIVSQKVVVPMRLLQDGFVKFQQAPVRADGHNMIIGPQLALKAVREVVLVRRLVQLVSMPLVIMPLKHVCIYLLLYRVAHHFPNVKKRDRMQLVHPPCLKLAASR